MKKTGFFALVAATLVAVIVAVGLALTGPRTATQAEGGETVLPTIAARLGDVGALALKRGQTTITLQRRDAQPAPVWVVAEKGNYPADPGKVRQALLGLAELKLVEAKTSKPELYPRLDLEDPAQEKSKATLVEVKDAKGGKLGELIVGKRRPDRLGTGTDGVYVRRPGEAQAWLAQGNLDLTGDTKDWLDKHIASIETKRIREVVITQPDGATLTLARPTAEAKFALVGAAPDAKPKSEQALEEPAHGLDALELSDVQPAAALPVPAEGVTTARYTTFDGLVVTAKLFEKDGTNWIRLTAEGSGDAQKEAADLQAKLSPWVYAVPAYKAGALKTKPADVVEAPKAS